ncbi:hypothetical protein ABPG75_013764 [Micractinium tetrahymenae]
MQAEQLEDRPDHPKEHEEAAGMPPVPAAAAWRNSRSRASLLAFTAAKCTAAVFVLGWPDTFWAHRLPLMPLIRIAPHLLPHVRQTGVGAALVLERAARPGVAGLVYDAVRVLAGTRQLGLAVGGVIFTLPPVLTLLHQSALLGLTTSSAACSSQLLADPLTQRRAASFATTLEFVATPMLVFQPLVSPAEFELATRLLAGQADAAKVCQATLSFAHLVLCVLLPVLLSVYCWPRQGGVSAGGAPAGAGAAAGSGWRGLAAKASQRCSEAAAVADSWMSRLLHTPARCDAREVVSIWWLLSVCWLACKHAAGLR